MPDSSRGPAHCWHATDRSAIWAPLRRSSTPSRLPRPRQAPNSCTTRPSGTGLFCCHPTARGPSASSYRANNISRIFRPSKRRWVHRSILSRVLIDCLQAVVVLKPFIASSRSSRHRVRSFVFVPSWSSRVATVSRVNIVIGDGTCRDGQDHESEFSLRIFVVRVFVPSCLRGGVFSSRRRALRVFAFKTLPPIISRLRGPRPAANTPSSWFRSPAPLPRRCSRGTSGTPGRTSYTREVRANGGSC